MARDKYYEARMQGAVWAGNLIKKEGLEAFDRDMRKRNLLKFAITVTEKEMDETYRDMNALIYHTLITGVLWTLHDMYAFGKKRLKEFKEAFDKTVEDTFDLDYMGEHYVRLEDFAVELNQRYDLGIDIPRVAVVQESYDKRNSNYHMLRTERVIQELREAGYPDAAKFLEAKLD